MSKFEFNYDGSKLNYPATLLTVLQDICEKAGVGLGSTSFLNSNVQVATYDNTISAREYLSYIAESAGGFAFIGRDGKLYIRTIYQDEQQIPTELLGDFKWGEQCKITKVSYENGVESFKFGDSTGNNLWLNQENMYIIDEGQVEAIYNQVKDLVAYSFEGKTIIDPALDVGDKIIIDGKPIIYQGEANFQTRFIVEISSKIAIKQKQETTVKTTSQKVINRRVQSRIDETEGKITQLVKENSEFENKLTQVEQTVDSITQTVSSMETKVEQVEEKADIANTNAQNAQTTANTAQSSADKAQQTADGVVSQITTTNQKLSQIEQTVEGITQSVSAVEEQIETVETKADNAQSTANTAQTTANEAKDDANSAVTTANEAKNTAETTNNNLATNYYTKTETNSQINQKANEITSTVNQTYSTKEETTQAKQDAINSANESTDEKLEDYSTTEEMNSAITQKADSITSEVSKTYSTKTETSNAKNEAINSANASTDEKLEDYTQTSEFGTLIEQNWEHVKIAWNQISQYIQLEGDNGNATMAFYDNNTKFAEMGVNTVDNDRYISFAIPCDYGHDIADGMSWGIQTTSDNKFWPILYIKNFHMANKNAGDFSGELVLEACNLALEGINSSITCGNVKMTTAGVFGGIAYLDQETGSNLLSITPETILSGAEIKILDSISFFANSGGTNSLKIGTSSNYCLLEDTGYFTCYNASIEQIYVDSSAYFYCNLNVDGRVYADNISSDRKLKEDIEDCNINALELIKKIRHRQFKMKKDGTHYDVGYIAQELEEIDKNFVMIREKTEDTDERYYVNELPIIATITKAIQEQQEQIEKILKELEVKNNE